MTSPHRSSAHDVTARRGSGGRARREAGAALDVAAVAVVQGAPRLAARWDVDALAADSVAAFADALAALVPGEEAPRVDRGRVATWFRAPLQPVGWAPPSPWDAIAGDYRAADGWIRLHTNAPRHRAAALRVLGCAPEREAVAERVARMPAQLLESAVVEAGGAAAAMRTAQQWRAHPQGGAVAREPLIARSTTDPGPHGGWAPSPGRPLAGVRVLDATRVIAGPVAGRALAAYGAEVLRVDPPDWDEPALVPETTLGKRAARLDARTAEGRQRMLALIAGADVLIHGYRRDALDGLGLGEEVRRAARPGLVEVALTAYGWSGPWADRRGFDSLVQMSAGIAERGSADAGRPVPLPVQALDHATGWLMAAAAVAGLRDRLRHGAGSTARLSLARTAAALAPLDGPPVVEPAPEEAGRPITTPWGAALLAPPPLEVAGAPFRFDAGPAPLGADPAAWLPR